MDTFGRHLLVEFHGCDRKILNDEKRISALLHRAVLAAKATPVGEVFHRFSPQGVSGVVVIEESHLSIHTWPEDGYAAVDFYTCGECFPDAASEVMKDGLGAESVESMLVHRGVAGEGDSMQVRRHRRVRAEEPAAE